VARGRGVGAGSSRVRSVAVVFLSFRGSGGIIQKSSQRNGLALENIFSFGIERKCGKKSESEGRRKYI